MASVHKIFPFGMGNDPYNSFSLFIVAEGFQASQKRLFMDACHKLITKIFDTHPFGMAKIFPQWISVYTHFEASGQSGPSTTATASNRTLLDSVLNVSEAKLSLDNTKLASLVESLTVFIDNEEKALKEIVKKEQKNAGIDGNLIVVLLPESTSNSGGELEHSPGTDEYHYTAVTQNGEWHQVVLRSISGMFGLRDEFELEGPEHLAPSDEEKGIFQGAAPNLFYYDTAPSGIPDSFLPWYGLITKLQQVTAMPVNNHKGNDNIPNQAQPAHPYSADQIGLWEGGGGFRTKVYRPAKDCLLRRRIGDTSLPLRSKIVPFCPVCSKVLATIVDRN